MAVLLNPLQKKWRTDTKLCSAIPAHGEAAASAEIATRLKLFRRRFHNDQNQSGRSEYERPLYIIIQEAP